MADKSLIDMEYIRFGMAIYNATVTIAAAGLPAVVSAPVTLTPFLLAMAMLQRCMLYVASSLRQDIDTGRTFSTMLESLKRSIRRYSDALESGPAMTARADVASLNIDNESSTSIAAAIGSRSITKLRSELLSQATG